MAMDTSRGVCASERGSRRGASDHRTDVQIIVPFDEGLAMGLKTLGGTVVAKLLCGCFAGTIGLPWVLST
jgi:hypothetical protein